MYSLTEVKNRAKRENDWANRQLHPIAARVSIYFSWVFINLGFSPNTVTILFFLVGLVGGFLMLINSLWAILTAYILWRLHIIIDVSDGEVARFTQKFSINGAYWDYMIHAVLYPLYFANMCVAQYQNFENPKFLFLAIAGVLVLSLQLAVKNNYFRAMLYNDISLSTFKEKSQQGKKSGFIYKLYLLFAEVIGFEGLLLFYILIHFFPTEKNYFTIFIVYLFFFLGLTSLKFLMLSIKGFYTTKN